MLRSCGRCRSLAADRQCDRQGRALTKSLARHADGASMHFGEPSNNREPDAQTTMRARARRIRLPERLEHEGQEMRLDAGAGVAHFDSVGVVAAREPHRNGAAARRKPHRVGDQVPEHLLQAVGIAHGWKRPLADALQGHVPRVCGRPARIDRIRRDRAEVHVAHVQQQLARRDAGHVEQVLDQPRLCVRVAVDALERVVHLVGRELPAAEQVHPADDRVERRAELV